MKKLYFNIKKLDWNIKKELAFSNYKNFEEFHDLNFQKAKKKFIELYKEKNWFLREEDVKNLIFYFLFVSWQNYNNEILVLNYLKNQRLFVKLAFDFLDFAGKVDLIAEKENKLYFIQVKTNNFMEQKNLNLFFKFSKNKKATPIFSIIKKTEITFFKVKLSKFNNLYFLEEFKF
ncbi:hypothetical protein [Mycoplasmopsis synoviae]|uniref:YraN family protein n=1 Tax=Mycoplasmopsis synoviae TaxID=2109 RepID=A0AAX3EZA2_MYCSY|nr:hypothetical protein [Mycoplasmopsis synoviae]UZW64349.1 YraN family protein [Mycoplasmopsis synoviae]